jgi:hypothetical protein
VCISTRAGELEFGKGTVHLTPLLHWSDLLSLAGASAASFFLRATRADGPVYGYACGGTLAVGPFLVGVAVTLEGLGCGANVALLDWGGG